MTPHEEPSRTAYVVGLEAEVKLWEIENKILRTQLSDCQIIRASNLEAAQKAEAKVLELEAEITRLQTYVERYLWNLQQGPRDHGEA